MKALQERFGSNPHFILEVMDDSRGQGNAVKSSLEKVTPELRSSDTVAGVLKQKLDEEYRNGKISTKIYKATLGAYRGAKEIGI
jgi:hypothetical protein